MGAFSCALRESHPKGWRTSQQGVVSSVERFLWVRGLPDGGPAWLRAWNEKTCHVIARYGALEVLECAKANGCPWNEQTCHAAAKAGHLDVLQWAIANGCEWDAATCARAAQGGHLEVLNWAEENGCRCDGVFHSNYWLGQRANGLSRLLSVARGLSVANGNEFLG